MQVVNHEGMVVVRTMFSQTRMVGGQVGVIMRQVAKVRFWPDAQHCNQPNGPDPGEKKGGNRMPTKAQLFRSTVMAGIGAAVIMVTVYLPAEYAIDPTGIGRVIGLTEMGEIKV